MKRPLEHEYTSHVAYTRALEGYCDALEQPGQEPVGWMLKTGHGTVRLLYTAPPQRKPLTDEEIGKAAIAAGCDPNKDDGALVISLARAIEAAHGIRRKNETPD